MRSLLFRLMAVVGISCFALLSVNAETSEKGMTDYLEKVLPLPLLGHRNWVVVTDSAYPLQSNPGIKTLVVDDSQEEVVKGVFDLLKKQKHVRPVVYTDAELDFVSEENAPGISAYRKGLKEILAGGKCLSLPHEAIIEKLDKAGSVFNVIIIKTKGVLPYTSVFFELDCAYWSEKGENELRAAMKEKAEK